MHPVNEVDRLFAGLAAYGEAMAKRREELRERRRLATNARSRKLYAIRRAAGTLPSRRAPVIEPEPEYDAPAGCYCHVMTTPPCSWCEDGHSNDDDGGTQ